MRIALAQIDVVLGDFKGNLEKIKYFYEEALKNECDIIVFPELILSGYPPEDLLHNTEFIKENQKYLEEAKGIFKDLIGIFGTIYYEDSNIFNSSFLVYRDFFAKFNKTRLPNYSVFDEKRYFSMGNESVVVGINGSDFRIGLSICEDIWYPEGVIYDETIKLGANIIVNISSSPYYIGKSNEREEMLKVRARDYGVFVAYVNLVGAQDELVFDGGSMVISPFGDVLVKASLFREELVVTDIDLCYYKSKNLLDPRKRFLIDIYKGSNFYELKNYSLDYKIKEKKQQIFTSSYSVFGSEEEEIFEALKTSVRGYVTKNNFQKVVVGISGGIDSALVAVICTEALGKDKVIGVSMPSRFSSQATKSDARKLCENLGIKFLEIPIQRIFEIFLDELSHLFEGKAWDVTEENLQARIRGNILMALSNKFGYLVISTGNKSEMSMGYSTLYGDLAGGFALIKDIYKTDVYRLAKFVNQKYGFDIIPKTIIERPPTAELRENQKDQDTLPPYDILDSVLKLYIENELTVEDIHRITRIDEDLIKHIINTVNKNEYKRKQAPVGVKIHYRSFGKDRRYPITNKFMV